MTSPHAHLHQHSHSAAGDHSHSPTGARDEVALANLLDLDARVLRDYLAEAMSWVHGHAPDNSHRRVLDVGAGPGAGTLALAQRFRDAEVVAVDMSEEMLSRTQARFDALLMTDRVLTVQMNLDGQWPDLGSFDVVWASAMLHELSDPDLALRNIFDIMKPGGVLAVVEMTGPPLFLDAEVGDGFEQRMHDIVRVADDGHAYQADWTQNLTAAGFTLAETRDFAIDFAVGSSTDDARDAGHYAHTYFRRVHPVVGPLLAPGDQDVLNALVADAGPASLRERTDLHIRATRTAWMARRPQ